MEAHFLWNLTKLNGVNAIFWKWHVSALYYIFPVFPVACDQWRMHSSCFAVDACSCPLCSCPPCSCPLCSLPTVWIFLNFFPIPFSPPLGRERVVWTLSPKCFRGRC